MMNTTLAAATTAVEELEKVENRIAFVRSKLGPTPGFRERLLADYAETSERLSLPMGRSARLSWTKSITSEEIHAIEAWLPSLIEAMRESIEPVDVNVAAIDASTTADPSEWIDDMGAADPVEEEVT